MTKKIVLNEPLKPSGGCGCGHAAEHDGHAHESSAAHNCCGDAADHADAAHQHEKGCCGGSHATEEPRERADLPSIAERLLP